MGPAADLARDRRQASTQSRDRCWQAGGLSIRVASKSVRSRDVLRRVLARAGFARVLAYSLPAAHWLAAGTERVSDDVVVAYATADRRRSGTSPATSPPSNA